MACIGSFHEEMIWLVFVGFEDLLGQVSGHSEHFSGIFRVDLVDISGDSDLNGDLFCEDLKHFGHLGS